MHLSFAPGSGSRGSRRAGRRRCWSACTCLTHRQRFARESSCRSATLLQRMHLSRIRQRFAGVFVPVGDTATPPRSGAAESSERTRPSAPGNTRNTTCAVAAHTPVSHPAAVRRGVVVPVGDAVGAHAPVSRSPQRFARLRARVRGNNAPQRFTPSPIITLRPRGDVQVPNACASTIPG